jgi:hypothetical protein
METTINLSRDSRDVPNTKKNCQPLDRDVRFNTFKRFVHSINLVNCTSYGYVVDHCCGTVVARRALLEVLSGFSLVP